MALVKLHALLVFWVVPAAYGNLLLLGLVASRSRMLHERSFSLRRYYLLMGWAPLMFVVLGALVDARYLLLFVVAGLAGVLGELLVSLLWVRFFDRPIWTYSHRSVLRGYTSTINFFPWAVGGLLFILVGRLVIGTAHGVARPMLVSAAALAAGLALVWPARSFVVEPRREFTKPAFGLFCLPIGITAAALGAFCSPAYVLLMSIFALVGFLAEYGYGRSMTAFFDRELWTYNHWQIDGGHTSFVTFPLWALGGLYFYLIATLLGL